MRLPFRNRTSGELLAAAALTSGAAALWAFTFLGTRHSFFLADDSWFLASARVPLSEALRAFVTPLDHFGYYRPFAQLLWWLTRNLGATEFSSYQNVTILLLAGASVFLFVGLRYLFGSTPAALAAAAAYALSPLHAKPLLWITLWFNTAEGLFTVATLALFVLHARTGRRWLRWCGLGALALAYTTNNGAHAWGLVPLAVDAAFTPSARPGPWLRAVFRRARDHLLLSAVFLSWLYALNSPLGPHSGLELDLAPSHLAANFFSYLMATIAHLTGDGPAPAFFSQPAWLVAASLLAPPAAAVATYFDRRFLVVWAVWLAGAVVICPLRGRWECEYATAMLPGVLILLCGLLARGPKPAQWAIGAAWIALAFASSVVAMPKFTSDFLPRAEVNRRFVETLGGLHRAVSPERPFYFQRVESAKLTEPPFHFFFLEAMHAFFPERAYLLNTVSFRLPAGVPGDSNEPASRELVARGVPLRLSCNDDGCRALEP